MSEAVRTMPDDRRGLYTGWFVGGLVILAVFVAGAAFWFMYHP
ncbi:MAG TPA: hypothetical protein VEK13_01900 [Thermoplasmata archaeon]|nr:hypothetical protein [Thermoplasmata archaeon]